MKRTFMKKYIWAVLVLVMTWAVLPPAGALGSFFPSADSIFGISMPDMRFAIGREPDAVETVSEGRLHTYNGFTAGEYDLFSRYAAAEGLALDGFTTVEGVLTAVLSLNGQTVTFTCSYAGKQASVLYPDGTRPEDSASRAVLPDTGILPGISRAFGVAVPQLSHLLPGHPAPATARDAAGTDRILYTGVSMQDYYAINRHLTAKGYTAEESSVENGVMKAVLRHSSGTLRVSYDLEAQTITFMCPELYYIDSSSPDAAADGNLILPEMRSGLPMPSLFDVLRRYPDEVAQLPDGASEQRWTNVLDADFEAFGTFLGESGAALQDYTIEGGVFRAAVAKDGRTFSLAYHAAEHTMVMTYPADTYDERLFAVQSIWNAAEAAEAAGRYAEAAEKYASLIGYEGAVCYRDSDERELRCHYAEGEAMRAAQDWDGAAAAFTKAGTYSDAAVQITETKYLQAKALTAGGDYAGAVSIYSGIKGYKDVDSLLENDHNLSAAAARDAKYSVGKYVTFGHYPQTSEGNDSTEIEWLVLAREGNKALLLSRYGLDAKRYNVKYDDITWGESTLRAWLNGTFLKKAFTVEEQKGIEVTNVDNGRSQGYSKWSTSGGNNTKDKIFLLSYGEANKYLGVTYEDSQNTKSRVAPTGYALKQGAYTTSSNKTAEGTAAGWWWLRSPGNDQSHAALVDTDGSLNNRDVFYDRAVVRPALWINLESGIF